MILIYLCLAVTSLYFSEGTSLSQNGSNYDLRVAGGNVARISDFPYQVGILSDDNEFKYFCSGALLSNYHVITAKHCVKKIYDYGVKNVYLIAGTSKIDPYLQRNIENQGSDTQKRNINEINKNKKSDIAIITVTDPFSFTEKVQTINFQDFEVQEGTKCFLTGWGAVEEGDQPFNSDLQEVNISIRQCPDDVIDDIICAGSGGKGPCRGDDGAPLVCRTNQYFYLTGITSYGQSCGGPGYFVNLYLYKDWIKSIIGN